MLKRNSTLTWLGLIYNQIGDTQRQEINALIQRNQLMMLARRQQFLFKIIILARNAKILRLILYGLNCLKR
jgi:hypothetical protein